jgi:hypothetical protein
LWEIPQVLHSTLNDGSSVLDSLIRRIKGVMETVEDGCKVVHLFANFFGYEVGSDSFERARKARLLRYDLGLTSGLSGRTTSVSNGDGLVGKLAGRWTMRRRRDGVESTEITIVAGPIISGI